VLPALAPRGQINYHKKSCRSALNKLIQDVTKNFRKSSQATLEAIADTRATFSTDNPNITIEPVDRLPDMGAPTADPTYMPANQGSTKARTESAAERQRAATRPARPDATPVRERALARPLSVLVIFPPPVPGRRSRKQPLGPKEPLPAPPLAHHGPHMVDFQLELAPMVPLHTLGGTGLAASPTEPASSNSAVSKLAKPKGKLTTNCIVTDKDRKAAKGTMVGKVAKEPTVKGAMPVPAKEAILANEVRPAKPPKGVKRPVPGIGVKSTQATTTSLSVKGPTAPNLARTKRDGKASKRGPASKRNPIAPTPTEKPVAKSVAAARRIPATGGEQGTQAALRLASGTEEAGRPSSQRLSLAGSREDSGGYSRYCRKVSSETAHMF